MELVGEEKRIQALFSETSLHDRSTAPSFEKLWARAESAATRAPSRSRQFVFAVASVMLIVTASAFAAWSWYKATPTATQHDARIAPAPVITPLAQPAPELAQNSKPKPTSIATHPAHQKRARAPQFQRAALSEAALLSRWQSPTQLLMQFSKTVDLSSLPQLNQSAEALKQFLPANADLKKESNQ